jgi:Glycoside hydrolase family 5 C-terminal domain
LKHLSRPYAEAICGSGAIKSEFNTKLVTFELKYIDSGCPEGIATEIYLSEEFWFTNK